MLSSTNNFWNNCWLNNSSSFIDHCKFSDYKSYPCIPQYPQPVFSPVTPCVGGSPISANINSNTNTNTNSCSCKCLCCCICQCPTAFKFLFDKYLKQAIDNGTIPSGMTEEQFQIYFNKYLQQAISGGQLDLPHKFAQYIYEASDPHQVDTYSNIPISNEVQNTSSGEISCNFETGIFTISGPSKWLLTGYIIHQVGTSINPTINFYFNEDSITTIKGENYHLPVHSILNCTEATNSFYIKVESTPLMFTTLHPFVNLAFIKLN